MTGPRSSKRPTTRTSGGVTSVRCEKCDSPTRVLRTSLGGGGSSTVRRRVCRRGHEFTTIEERLREGSAS